MLRVLRPLRLISRFSGMRLVINLLIRTMPNVVSVMVSVMSRVAGDE